MAVGDGTITSVSVPCSPVISCSGKDAATFEDLCNFARKRTLLQQ